MMRPGLAASMTMGWAGAAVWSAAVWSAAVCAMEGDCERQAKDRTRTRVVERMAKLYSLRTSFRIWSGQQPALNIKKP